MNLKDFDDLITLGQVKRSVKVGNHTIFMKTLSSLEYNKAMDRVPSLGQPGVSENSRLDDMQREIISASIESIDGQVLSHEEKTTLLNAGQLGFANLLYSEYISMVEEQAQAIEDAKKNSSEAPTTSTESQKVPASR